VIDLHNHLLPAIDDGAKRLEESIEFLRIAQRDGIRTVVATPHMKPGVYDNTRATILERVALVREAQQGDKESEAVLLLPGAEVYFGADLPQRARAGSLMSVADRGKYLLLELPYQQVPMQVDETIFQLRLAGLTPIMAHPERVAYYLEDIERVEASVRIGALTQVTGASLTGRFGSKARDFSMAMLDRGLIHVLATDSHDVRHRPPVLSEAVRVVRERIGVEAARRMTEEIPRAILEGREIEAEPPPRRSRERLGILGRLAGFLRRR